MNEMKKSDSPSSPEQKRILELLRRAEAAYNKHNYRWAAELYGEIYAMDRVKNVEYLQKMILASLGNKNIAPNPYLFTFKAILNSIPNYINALRIKDKDGSLAECFDVYEGILRNNPDSAFAHISLSKLYEKHHLIENAAVLLESYTRTRKTDVSTLRRIGELYLKIENADKARGAFKKILEVKPFDQDAEKRLRDILAITSIDEAKLRGPGFKDSIKDKSSAYKTQIEMKMNKTFEELDYLINEKKKDIEREPLNVSMRYELLNYYKEKGDKRNIFKTLEGIAETAQGDLSIQIEKAEADIALYIDEAEKKGTVNEESKKEINLYKKKHYIGLLQAFSSSNDIKFNLAKIEMELEENDDALKLFQACSKVPELAVESCYCMGKILMRKQMYDIAVDQFKNAASQIKDMNNLKKSILYDLANTYEKIGKEDLAFEEYKAIYKEDMEFRGVAKKLEDYYKKKQEAGKN